MLRQERRLLPRTLVEYERHLNQFQAYCARTRPGVALSNMRHADLYGWLRALAEADYHPRTRNLKVSIVRNFYRFLEQRGEVCTNPAQNLPNARVPDPLPVHVFDSELAKCRKVAQFPNTFVGCRDKLIVELLYGTGMRVSELLSLRMEDINLKEYHLAVVHTSSRPRTIPFPSSLLPVLRTYLAQRKKLFATSPNQLLLTIRGHPLYRMAVYRATRKYLSPCTMAEKHSPQVLRHSYGAHLLDNGANLVALCQLMGHWSIVSTLVYTRVAIKHLKAALDNALPRGRPRPPRVVVSRKSDGFNDYFWPWPRGSPFARKRQT